MGMILNPNDFSLIKGVSWQRAVPSFFCDESGRSGPNYLDDAQPVHVVGGYLVWEGNDRVAEYLAPLKAEMAGAEVKSSKVLHLPRRQKLLSEFLACMQRQYFSVLVLVEKRYFAGMKLASALFASDVSVRARDVRRTPEVMQSIAEAFADLDKPVLQLLLNSLLRPSDITLGKCMDGARRDLERKGYSDLARFVGNVRPDVRALASALERDIGLWDVHSPTGSTSRAGNSLDLDAFVWCVEKINTILGYISQKLGTDLSAHVIWDEPTEKAAFERMFIGQRAVGSWSRLRDLRFGGSKHVVGIQAADLLVGTARACTTTNAKVPANLETGVDAILASAFMYPPQVELFGTSNWVRGWKSRWGDWNRRHLEALRRSRVSMLGALHARIRSMSSPRSR